MCGREVGCRTDLQDDLLLVFYLSTLNFYGDEKKMKRAWNEKNTFGFVK